MELSPPQDLHSWHILLCMIFMCAIKNFGWWLAGRRRRLVNSEQILCRVKICTCSGREPQWSWHFIIAHCVLGSRCFPCSDDGIFIPTPRSGIIDIHVMQEEKLRHWEVKEVVVMNCIISPENSYAEVLIPNTQNVILLGKRACRCN